jgi:rod shape-determining protein MreD
VKTVKVLGAILVALTLQTLASRFFAHSRAALDLVLVAVAFVALQTGPVSGMFAGTLGGLAQDALSTGIVGIGSLAKTTVGFLAGVVGTQFIVSGPIPRFVVFFAASFVQLGIVLALETLLDLRPMARSAPLVLMEALGNALVGIILFQLVDLLPAAVERRRAGRERVRAPRTHE